MKTSFEPVWHSDRPLFVNWGLPSSLRLLIIGKSNCGKSFLLLRLLIEGYLDYNNLCLFTPSLHQIEYQILVESLKHGLSQSRIMSIFDCQDDIDDPIQLIKEVSYSLGNTRENIKVEAYDTDEKLPKPETFDKKKKNLLVLDDCAYDRQSNIHSYFIRGRHNNINCIYLSQNYFQLPRKSIRANSNCFIFFKLNAKDLSNVWQDIASMDYPDINDFKEICASAWRQAHGYLLIDTTADDLSKKYRANCF